MGLDQFAYSVDKTSGEKVELAYWRKHPNLQGWMENLWESKGRPNLNKHDDSDGAVSLGDFNCVPVELTYEDLDSLESAISNNELPHTTGFFFGNNSDDHYKEQDLDFVEQARKALDNGLTVVYDSWW